MDAPPRPKRWIPGLDGLRAVAVIAVVLFHLSPDYLSGGFLGVDLFFVISGYLITRLLMSERQRTGRIAIGRFYLRRAKRLLPAVALLLATVAVAGSLIWPDQRPTLLGSELSSMGYATNWWLIFDQQSYFVAMGRPPMLQHLWSLAIEEQYYLLWAPTVLLLTGAWVTRILGRRRVPLGRLPRPALLATFAAAAALASTVAMAVIAIRSNVPYQTDSSRVYFGTDTHAMGLLLGSAVGALAALPWRSLHRRVPGWVRPTWRSRWAARPLLPAWIVGNDVRRPLSPWLTDLLGLAALAGVAWFFVTIDEYVPWLYRGGFLAFAAVAIVGVVCAARVDGHLGRVLDVAPLRWIGERSYGIYLWHWPVFVVTRPMIDVHGPAWVIDLARCGLAVAIAAASYRYLETPVREGRFWAGIRELATRRPGAWAVRRHWALPTAATLCTALLVVAHVSALQQPVWAASVPSAALPVPGVTPQPPAGVPRGLPGGVPGGAATGAPGDVSRSVPPGEPGSLPVGGPATTVRMPPATALTTPLTTATTASPQVVSPLAPSSAKPARGTSPGASTGKAPRALPPSVTRGATPPATTAARPTAHAKVSAFGDSVLLGAAPAVRAAVGSLTVDAVVGRQAWDTLEDVADAARAGTLAPVVLIHTGNNGIISPKQLAATLSSLANRARVVVVNDHVDRAWQAPNNRTIAAVAGTFKNVVIVDWNATASQHPGWFGPDGIHVNPSGAQGYAALVAAAIR